MTIRCAPLSGGVPCSVVMGFALVLLGCIAPVHAQQLLNARNAVQPSEGLFSLRQFAAYHRFVNDPNAPPGNPGADIDQTYLETVLSYGLTRNVTLMGHLPLVYRDYEDLSGTPGARDDDFGVSDITLMAQYRFWKQDTSAINTQRAVVYLGGEVPTFDSGFSSESFDPLLGLGYTAIQGRNGFGGGVQWKFNTGSLDRPILFGDTPDDALCVDLSYAYRIDPVQYDTTTTNSSFVTVELLTRYETNGDTEVLIVPGFLFEETTWAAGVSVQLPIHQELDERPQQRVGVVAEFRVLF